MEPNLESRYLIEFKSNDDNLADAGFDVCLAITTLELPLDIVVNENCADLFLKLKSLSDYGMANIYSRTTLDKMQYQTIAKAAKYFLEF